MQSHCRVPCACLCPLFFGVLFFIAGCPVHVSDLGFWFVCLLFLFAGCGLVVCFVWCVVCMGLACFAVFT